MQDQIIEGLQSELQGYENANEQLRQRRVRDLPPMDQQYQQEQ